ncbi:hypothetical protein CI102_3280 [Trichoderma harzianum]|uniref:Uncharacterized protein n=1 Tax=Trichoderma harzianum CBS 226.95 TaxID=983964 RepID=A0A2T4AF30_TRIHA|nr:hypothetical protein M431DRAFT_405170 [Trichoderma harzianum CBS 226.95]PKK51822.1 hypothetical protein CI102_3280 [Trichoderma harzianum]PTB55623.1 hypothetical protein M431DRAFT_405170 [Trichoderma harzianum CBS 226.95]
MPESLPVSKAWLHRPHLFVFFLETVSCAVCSVLVICGNLLEKQAEEPLGSVCVCLQSGPSQTQKTERRERRWGEKKSCDTLSAVFLDFLRLRQQQEGSWPVLVCSA